MGGYGNGLFGVNDNLSRAQLAQILYNKEGTPAGMVKVYLSLPLLVNSNSLPALSVTANFSNL